MKTIIIPTDFSANSIKALDFALDFFSKENNFIVCNTFEIPRGGTSSLFMLMEELRDQAERDMKELMHILKEEQKEVFNKITSRVMQGDFTTQINALASEVNADYIIMGTKGASGIKEVLIGSNAAHLVGNSKVPIITVPEDYEKSKVEDLVLCYDGKKMDKELATQLHDFSNVNNLKIKVFHVRSAEESPIQNWGELEELIGDDHSSLHEELGDSFEEGLAKRMEQFHSILVLIRRKRNFWEKLLGGSHSKKVVSRIALPVMILPEQ